MAVRYPGQTDEGTTPARDPESRAPEARVPEAREPEAATPGATSPLAHPPRLARHTPAPGAVVRAMEIACNVPPAAVPLVREALALALPGIPVTVAEARTPEARAPEARAPEAGEPAAESSLAPAWAALRRTRQQVAMGEAAAGLQHALANPLTALLFEAQLLQMEALPPALAEAVGRIVTQCRRTIEVARRLDGAGAAGASSPAAGSARHDIRNPL